MTLFSAGESTTGLYTVTALEDGVCSNRVQNTLLVVSRPVITLHSVVGDVCGGTMARLEIRMTGGTLPWQAAVRYPDGDVRKIESEKHFVAWDVSLPGEYTLVGGSSGACAADSGDQSAGTLQSVHVRHFDAPTASIAGDVMTCVGQQAEITVQVVGGQWPYSVVLLHNGTPLFSGFPRTVVLLA